MICDFKKLLTLLCRCHKSYIDQLLVDHRVYAIQFENTLFDQSVLLDVTGLLFFVFYWFCWGGCIWGWPFGRPRIRKKTSVWSGCSIWLLGYVLQWVKKSCYEFVFFHSCTNICLAFFTYSFAKKKIKKKSSLIFKKRQVTFTLLIIFIVKSLQIELHSTNLLLWPLICRNKRAITPKWFNS